MNDELLARCRSFIDEQSCGEWDDKAINEDAAKLYEFVQREAASALRLAAQSPEPVTVKPLVWVDHRPDSFPEPAWSAQTPFGFYNIEEVSASDCPAYVVRLHAHRFVADKDSLDDAKAAAQADYEARIRSALVNAPMSASDGALRKALEPFAKDADNWADTVPDDHRSLCTEPGSQYPHPGSETIFTVGDLRRAKAVLAAASEATKSDGGEERPASNPLSEVTHRPSDPKTSPELLALLERAKSHVMTPEDVYEQRRSFVRGMCPSDRDYTEWCADVDRIIPPLAGPSDTRPADVTVDEPRCDCGHLFEICDAPNCNRALLDTYKIGAK